MSWKKDSEPKTKQKLRGLNYYFLAVQDIGGMMQVYWLHCHNTDVELLRLPRSETDFQFIF